jgi:lipid II:glycine glycyltransferase (peptidoglycan interpeptide bridge formation enzyme)
MSLVLNTVQSPLEWESFLQEVSPQSLFQSWTWGEVQKKTGQTVLRYGIFEKDILIGIMQVFVVRARRGTYLHIRHGPVLKNRTAKIWKELLVILNDVARQYKAWFIRISPLLENSPENRQLFSYLNLRPAPIHEVDAERCWVLDITQPEEMLLAGMRKSTRYEIRRGMKMDIPVHLSTDARDLRKFEALYKKTSERQGFVGHSSIQEEFVLFAKENQAMLFLGYVGKQLISGAITLFYGGQAIYHHGASIPSKTPVSYAVQWKSILEAKNRGINVYNFYGIAPEDRPNHPWRGLTLFKKGFGGREINYIHAHDYPTSPWYYLTYIIEFVRTKLRGY